MPMMFGCVQHDATVGEYLLGRWTTQTFGRVNCRKGKSWIYTTMALAYLARLRRYMYDVWRDFSTFGLASRYQSADFKSALFSSALAKIS